MHSKLDDACGHLALVAGAPIPVDEESAAILLGRLGS